MVLNNVSVRVGILNSLVVVVVIGLFVCLFWVRVVLFFIMVVIRFKIGCGIDEMLYVFFNISFLIFGLDFVVVVVVVGVLLLVLLF